MADILLRNVFKKYGDFTAVKNLNLEINNREFLVLLGPSGCGKTTTLRCISGLETPTSGQILLDGVDVTNKRASRRDIAFVFQMYALYPKMSVFKNIAFPLKTQGVSKDEIKKAVMKTAEVLQITHILRNRPKELSGGDMQRVALARALVRKPKVFLLDEPIGTMDATFREDMRTELKRLHVDEKATTVYVTHDQVEAMAMGDRIAVMNMGKLQQVGEPHEVYANPSNLFVANFVGSPGMNFLGCKMIKNQSGEIALQLQTDSTLLSIPEKLNKFLLKQYQESRDLVLGIRPEHVKLNSEMRENHIPTTVFVHEKMGSYHLVGLKYGQEILRARTHATNKFAIDETVFVSFNMDSIRLFDSKTEQSLVQ